MRILIWNICINFSHIHKSGVRNELKGEIGGSGQMKQRWDVEVAGLESEMDVGLELELEVLKELCRDESAPN